METEQRDPGRIGNVGRPIEDMLNHESLFTNYKSHTNFYERMFVEKFLNVLLIYKFPDIKFN